MRKKEKRVRPTVSSFKKKKGKCPNRRKTGKKNDGGVENEGKKIPSPK